MDTELQDNDFEAAFAQATSGVEPPAEPPVEPVVPAEPTEVVVPAAEPVVPAEPTEVVVPAAESTPPSTPPAAPAPSENDAELARLRRENDELQARLKNAEPEPAAPAEAAAPAEPAAPKELLTTAERAKIKEYQDDWPDVAGAEELLRREMSEKLKAEIYTAVGQVFQQFYQMMQPVMSDFKNTSLSRREIAISAQAPDYMQIRPAVVAWAEQQPSMVAKAYKETLDSGSIDDVIKVVSLYKQAVGQTIPKATQPTAPTPVSAPALEPVQGGRRTTPVVTETNKDDFNGGWAEALGNVH